VFLIDHWLLLKFDLIWKQYFEIKHSGLLVLGLDSLNDICNAIKIA